VFDLYSTNETKKRCAEERLLLAVINLAVFDAMERPSGVHPNLTLTENARTAVRFLFGPCFKIYCGLLGFDVNYMLKRLKIMSESRYGGKGRLTDEQRRAFRANVHLWKEKVRMQ
jgi:hypothetical protein